LGRPGRRVDKRDFLAYMRKNREIKKLRSGAINN